MSMIQKSILSRILLLLGIGVILVLLISSFVVLYSSYYLSDKESLNQKLKGSNLHGNGDNMVVITLQNKEWKRNLIVEVAKDDETRKKGLMFRKSLEGIDGMLFIFESEGSRAFWMKDTYIPLDIIFFSSKKKFVNVAKNAQPCVYPPYECRNYDSVYPSQYVLEVQTGFIPEAQLNANLSLYF